MSLLMIGLSHQSAPITLLERVVLDATAARTLARDACEGGFAREALVLATCNRLEVYAEVDSFHPALSALTALLAQVSGVPGDELAAHLTFSHGDAATERLFTVTAGLDSMALGETQVMGQVRSALRRGQEDGTVGRVLDPLVQHALRAGKRVHAETALDTVARSLLDTALGDTALGDSALCDARALVVGAGSMSALVATTLARRGVGHLTIAGRTPDRAARLAAQVRGTWVDLRDDDAMVTALAEADLVVSCTGATGHVLDLDLLAPARAHAHSALLLVDLALPRDIDPAVVTLPGVRLVGLEELHERGRGEDAPEVAAILAAARAVVAEEVAANLRTAREASVAPLVAALRAQARSVVDAEVSRLRTRLAALGAPDAGDRVMSEVERTVHRVVEKLLHTPSVRVRALAGSGEGESYAQALRELFDLHERVAAVTATGTVGEVAVPVGAAVGAVTGPVAGPLQAGGVS